jgi:hypothetical protein
MPTFTGVAKVPDSVGIIDEFNVDSWYLNEKFFTRIKCIALIAMDLYE